MMTSEELRTAKHMRWVEDIIAFVCLIGIGAVMFFFWVATP